MEIQCHVKRKYAPENSHKSREKDAENAAKVGECGMTCTTLSGVGLTDRNPQLPALRINFFFRRVSSNPDNLSLT